MSGMQRYKIGSKPERAQDGWGRSVVLHGLAVEPSNYGEWVLADDAQKQFSSMIERIKALESEVEEFRRKSKD